MRRAVAFRPCLVIFAFCAAGVLFSLVAHNFMPLGAALLAGLFASAAVGCAVYAFRRKPYKAITFAVAIAVTAAASAMFLSYVRTSVTLREDITYTISGRITEYFSHDGGELVATIDDLSANGRETDGRMEVTLTDDFGLLTYLGCGDNIMFTAKPIIISAADGMTVNASSVRSDIRYYAYADESDVISSSAGEPTTLEAARLFVRDALLGSMGEDLGGVAYGMIIGDRYVIPETANEAFSAAGVGHILSVSGLHIALTAMLLTRLLDALRVPRLAGGIAMTALLALYTVFTGAAPSAVRSLVMYVIFIWSRYFGKYDPLNSLAAASVVCLMISPLYLFECGFLMSSGAVLGLIMFSAPLTGGLAKIGLPRFLASGLGSSLAVQVAIIPLTMVFFSEIGLYSAIVNALLMPVLSGIFIVLVAALPLLLVPPLSFLGVLPAFGVGWVSALSAFTAALPCAVITVRVSALAAALLPLSFLAGRFVLVGNKYSRLILTAVLSCAVLMASENGLRTPGTLVLLGGSHAASVYISDDEVSVVADWTRGGSAAGAISRSRIVAAEFDVYALTLDYENALGIAEFAEEQTVRRVIFPYGCDIGGLGVLVDCDIPVIAASDNDALDIAYVGGEACGWLCRADGKLCFITSSVVRDEYTEYFDVLRGKSYYGDDPSVIAAFTDNGVRLGFGRDIILASRRAPGGS